MTEKHSPIYVSAHVVTNLHPNPDPGCLLTYESVDLNSLSSEVADMHQVDQIVAELNTAASLKTLGLNSMIDHLPSLPSLFVVVQTAKHDGSEPVGASGVCRSASSCQWKGEFCFRKTAILN